MVPPWILVETILFHNNIFWRQNGLRRAMYEILYLRIFRKSAEKIQKSH